MSARSCSLIAGTIWLPDARTAPGASTSANWPQTLTAGSGALSAVGTSLTAFAHTSTAVRCSQRRDDARRTPPAEVGRRAAAARGAARDLVRWSQQPHDNADVLMREAEVALDERRKALRWSLSHG